jgi:hypothetical protein
MAKLTSKMVKEFWKRMCGHYGTEVVDKPSAKEMKAIGGFLDAVGVLDKEAFLRTYATTLWNRIYVPFELGNAKSMPLLGQVAVCVHEHVHAGQFQDPTFPLLYITSTRERALAEARAYRTNFEMYWFLAKQKLSPKAVAHTLVDYGCTPKDITAAENFLVKASLLLGAAPYTSEARKALALLKELQ